MSLHEITIAPPPPAPTRRPDPAPASIPVIKREFNGGILQRSDPMETAGLELERFGFVHSYTVEREHHRDLVEKLHGAIHQRMDDGDIPEVRLELVDFEDVKLRKSDPPRRYTIAESTTVRNTRMGIYSTFRTYGDHLYVSIRSFSLRPLSVGRMVMSLLLNAFLIFVLPGMIQDMYPIPSLDATVRFAALAWMSWTYRGLFRSLLLREPVGDAFRRQFPKQHDPGSFNRDDILIFFQSALPALLGAVERVFKEAGIPVEVLQDAITQIVNNYNTSVNNHIDTAGGAFTAINSALGVITAPEPETSTGSSRP